MRLKAATPGSRGRNSFVCCGPREFRRRIRERVASVTVPFSFSAGNQYVPAGSYKVELLSDRYPSLRNTATNQTHVVMVRPETGLAIETRGRLVFQHEGSRKYLAQVWIAGTSLHSEVTVQHKRESESAKSQATPPPTVELALK